VAENELNEISLVYLDNIKKSFATNLVLKGVTLKLSPGEIVAIIGGNGAGKSTLMKILMGIYTPDSGNIYIDGEKSSLLSPSASLQKGIYYVPQEPMLFPNMTVEENVLIGMKGNRKALKHRLVELMKRLGWNISLSRTADTLSIAEQQLIEIVRGLLRDSKILILDEPTSSLTFKEIESLFKIMKDLREQGIGMFYITHRLTEVFEISTHVVLLRDGKITSSGPVVDFNKDMLIKGLLPEDIKSSIEKGGIDLGPSCDYTRESVLELEKLSGYGFKDVSFKLYPGEILGIAGVVGAGRTELAEAIFGIGEITSGKVLLNKEDITGCKTVDIVNKGLNYVPEDRHYNGIFSITDVVGNMTSCSLRNLSKFYTDFRKEREIANKYIQDFRIKVTGHDQLMKSLSGGNQQKVVIARMLATMPKVLVLDEPTRGIDAAARADVYKIIHELKNEGLAVLLISSDLEEIVELADRSLTMYNGIINGEFRKEHIDIDKLMAASFGVLDKGVV